MATVAMPTVVVALLLTSVKSCIDKLQLPFGNGLVFLNRNTHSTVMTSSP